MIEHSLVRSLLIPDIVTKIVQHFPLSERGALNKFYRSTTGAALADEATGLYGQSALHIFGLYVDELGMDIHEILHEKQMMASRGLESKANASHWIK